MKKFTTRQTAILLGGLVILALIGYLLLGSLRSKSQLPEVELAVWGTDPQDAWSGVLQRYQDARPNVNVAYKMMPSAGYEEEILKALAGGRGPDVFMISSHGVPDSVERLAPADPLAQMNVTRLRDLYPAVAEQDFVIDGKVYALPLYIDSLALIYSKDRFDSAGIVRPPATWNDFQNAALALRRLGEGGQVLRAGAAMGGSSGNVPRAVDTVYALMLQNGTQMVTPSLSAANFVSEKGLEAFNFYLRFADSASPLYTWNASMPSAPEALAGGVADMMLGYKSDADAIAKKSPFLPVGVAQLPQLSPDGNAVTYAEYQGLAVAKQSPVASWGWDFAVFAATNADAHRAYLASTKRPPALRSVIAEFSQDPDLAVFAKQALYARSWHQADAPKIEAAFDDAIRSVITGQLDSLRALRQAKEEVDELMRQ